MRQLLQILADGRPYTSTQLIRQLGITVIDLKRVIKTLIDYGIPFNPASPYNYQLSEPLELLDQRRILMRLSSAVQQELGGLEIIEVIDSTNRYLLEQNSGDRVIACLAEYQTAGRGRQGRRWISPYGSGLCLSVKYRYEVLHYSLGGLTIALAIGVAQVLQELGANEVQLKWPNDVVWRGLKLAGVLLESRTLGGQVSEVVMGVGVNVKLPLIGQDLIGQPWVDLQTVLGVSVSRNQLAALLINRSVAIFRKYCEQGLVSFMPDWQKFDMIYGKTVTLTMPSGNSTDFEQSLQISSHRGMASVKRGIASVKEKSYCITGTACGIDDSGALWLQIGNRKERYLHGEVSLQRIEA